VRDKQYSETDSSALSGDTGKYMNSVDFSPGLRLRQQCQLLTSGFFVKEVFLKKELIETKKTAINDESKAF